MRRGSLLLTGVVFVASIATLAASTGFALWDTTDELAASDRLRDIVTQLADESREVVADFPPDEPGMVLSEADNRRLAEIVIRVLANYPEAEGGFYLGASDQFAGVIATAPFPQEKPPADKGKKAKADKKAEARADKKFDFKLADAKAAASAKGRREPPPMETDPIRQQSRAALTRDPGLPPQVEIRDIGPSRVAVAAQAVGEYRPAVAAVWVMNRLTGPEQQKARLGRLQLATGLATFGVLLALGLAAGLVRSLQRETRRQQQLRDELQKSEHLAGLGRLLAGVAHEVRNPLTAIRSTVQLWQRLPEQTRTAESQGAVIAAVDRLNELVGRLLLFARSGHESRRPADLNAIATETLELVRARAEAQGVTIEMDFGAKRALVLGSSQSLAQVVLNLVTNALQAMPGGGRLACTSRERPDGRIALDVADSGPGVPADARERIFEPFFTTRPEGAGIGLALCREVARQHGGDVTLESPVGAGAVFRLTLPLASDGAS